MRGRRWNGTAPGFLYSLSPSPLDLDRGKQVWPAFSWLSHHRRQAKVPTTSSCLCVTGSDDVTAEACPPAPAKQRVGNLPRCSTSGVPGTCYRASRAGWNAAWLVTLGVRHRSLEPWTEADNVRGLSSRFFPLLPMALVGVELLRHSDDGDAGSLVWSRSLSWDYSGGRGSFSQLRSGLEAVASCQVRLWLKILTATLVMMPSTFEVR